MIIDIVLDSDVTKTLSLYDGEEPENVAKLFASQHSIIICFFLLFFVVMFCF